MKELLLIPGPTPVSEEILSALSIETIAHTDDRFVKIMLSALDKTKEVFGTKTGFPFIIAGSGTLGMEIALTNVINENDNLLVISHGFFGDRFAEIGNALGITSEIIKAQPGDRVKLEEIEHKLNEKHFNIITITHVDTSTGVIADVGEIASFVHIKSPDTLILVDGVCASGGVREEFDRWGVDVIFTGSQKALAVPPGLTLLAFSSRAIEKRKSLKKMCTYYGDILKWFPVMEDPHKYFATPAVNMVYALEKSLSNIFSIGLENYFEKHIVLARRIRCAMKVLGLEILANYPAPTLSVFRYPEGVDDVQFRKALFEKGVVVAAALKELSGKYFRMGHMGSLSEEDLFIALKRIIEVFEGLGIHTDKGRAFEAFFS